MNKIRIILRAKIEYLDIATESTTEEIPVEVSTDAPRSAIITHVLQELVMEGGVLRPLPNGEFAFLPVKKITFSFPTIALASNLSALPALRLN